MRRDKIRSALPSHDKRRLPSPPEHRLPRLPQPDQQTGFGLGRNRFDGGNNGRIKRREHDPAFPHQRMTGGEHFRLVPRLFQFHVQKYPPRTKPDRFLQCRNRKSQRPGNPLHLGRGHERNRHLQAGKSSVMMNNQHSVGRTPDIDLDPIRPGRDRRFERRHRVFMRGCILAPMPCAAVSDDQRPGSATIEKGIETSHGCILRADYPSVKKMPNCRSIFRHPRTEPGPAIGQSPPRADRISRKAFTANLFRRPALWRTIYFPKHIPLAFFGGIGIFVGSGRMAKNARWWRMSYWPIPAGWMNAI
jgi:hypothetical protein